MNIGDQILWGQFATTPDNSGAQPYMPTQYDSTSARAVLADIARRLSNLEGAVSQQVTGGNVVSKIQLSQEAILIQSDRIGVLGQTTFADYVRVQNGTIAPGGNIDPSITQIVGGVIKTGEIQNLNATSFMNLDATTTGQKFIQCASALSIFADGQFTFGDALSGKQLKFDLTNLTLGGNSLMGTSLTALDTVVSGAANGTTALATKLNSSAADVLGGNITFGASGAFQIGTASWNGVSASGTGVLFNQNGIVSVNAGALEFVLNGSSGSATFAGALNAATGTFAGDITGGANINITGNGIFNGLTAGGTAGGYWGIVANSSESSSIGGLLAYANSATIPAIYAFQQNASGFAITASGPIQVQGYATHTGYVGTQGYFQSTAATGTAPVQVTSTTLCTNLNAQLWNGLDATGTSTTATAGTAGALPATAAGYLTVTTGGSTVKFPYYNP